MRKIKALLGLGIWIAILPYLGFPSFWKDVLFTLSGLGLIYLSFILYREARKGKTEAFDNFSENSR